MRLLTTESAERRVLCQLGLGEGVISLASAEAVAALLRRAAGFLCPCPGRTLVDAVHRAAGPWLGEDSREEVRDILEKLCIAGDLVEMRPAGGGGDANSRLFYLAAPAFLLRDSGAVYLQGVVPDQAAGLPAEFAALLQVRGISRRLPAQIDIDWEPLLLGLGYAALPRDHWFGAPAPSTAAQHCARYSKQLDTSRVGGATTALNVIDPAADPTYYQGRWTPAGERRGTFVGRRDVQHGRKIWCFVRIDGGQILQLYDLQPDGEAGAGASEAWHLQMALDACTDTPQRFSLRTADPSLGDGEVAVDLFSPLPLWAERRLEALGRRLDRKGPGAIFTFALPEDEVEEETRFLTRVLFLQPKS